MFNKIYTPQNHTNSSLGEIAYGQQRKGNSKTSTWHLQSVHMRKFNFDETKHCYSLSHQRLTTLPIFCAKKWNLNFKINQIPLPQITTMQTTRGKDSHNIWTF